MSKSPLATIDVPAYTGNYTIGRSGRKIEAITIHHMAGVLSAVSCGRIFQTPGRDGSSHYGIGNDGEIASYVDENNTAWTNSNWDSNCKSVTIETSNSLYGGNWAVSDKALNSLIRLVADISKRNNLGTLVKGKNVTWHSMFTNTNCPGPYLLSKMDYIISEANRINNTSTNAVDVFYRVKTKKHGWLPEVRNLDDYAGWENSDIIGVAIRVNRGSIRYRVHIKEQKDVNGNIIVKGRWLGYITGCDINDYYKGYAGNDKPIDAIEVYYYTPNDIKPYKRAKYKVNNYEWQYDNETKNNQDGYAGKFGVVATKFQLIIE